MRDSGDLREYLDAVDLCYFGGQLEQAGVEIRWMRPHRRLIDLAEYDFERKQIRLSRVLAYPWVPLYFVLFTIYHEGIHAMRGDGEHDASFAREERLFAQAYEALTWERIHGPRLHAEPCPRGLH